MHTIDAHNHVYYCGLGPADVVREMDAYGIERTWVLTWCLPPDQDAPANHGAFNPRHARADGTHAGSTLDDVAEACQRFPERFVAGYCPCPADGAAPQRLEAAHRMLGVRVCGEWSYRMLLDDPRALELFRKAGELGLPVVLHLDAPFLPDPALGRPRDQTLWYGGGAGSLERALQGCPDTVFVGHGPGFWRYLSGDEAGEPEVYPKGPVKKGGELIRLLDSYENLWADLSARSGLGALRRDEEHARRFLARYQDRLLFGRDAAGDDLRRFVVGLKLEAKVLRKLLRDNAVRLVPASAGRG